jgi:hypothetical protein
MARAQGIPAGTVRWLLNERLRRLRARLDEAHGGSRDAWKAILVPPVAAPALGSGIEATAPASAPFSLRKVAGLAGGAVASATVAGLLLGPPHSTGIGGAGRQLLVTPGSVRRDDLTEALLFPGPVLPDHSRPRRSLSISFELAVPPGAAGTAVVAAALHGGSS